MNIDRIAVNNKQQVVIETGGNQRLLPNGVFRSEMGELITVTDGAITNVVTKEVPSSTDAWVALVEDLGAQLLEGSAQLDLAVARTQEMLVSFNLQYLQLQQKLQQDNRQFTTVSNIMKTKLDQAKNAINNIR